MKKIVRAASLSAAALAIGMSAVACSGTVEVSPTGGSINVDATPSAEAPATASSAPTSESKSTPAAPVDSAADEKTAAGAKKTTDAFLAQINDDMEAFVTASAVAVGDESAPKQLSNAEFTAILKESSAKTATYLKPGSFDDKQIKNLFAQFGSVYYESKGVGEAAIVADESGVILTGDTAVIKGESFQPSIDGKPVDVGTAQSGDLTLEYVDGKWLVSGHAPTATK